MSADTPNSGDNYRRAGDYIFFCDVCGDIEWASKGTLLSTYTGYGSQMACPSCVLVIDYSLVPYKVPAEKNIPWARPNTLYDTPAAQIANQNPPYNYIYPPGSGNPNVLAEMNGEFTIDQELYINIEELVFLTIDQILGTTV